MGANCWILVSADMGRFGTLPNCRILVSADMGPAQYSEGVKYVIINGEMVVKDGILQSGVHPGRPIRAPF
jgi:hypothetical protein